MKGLLQGQQILERARLNVEMKVLIQETGTYHRNLVIIGEQRSHELIAGHCGL